MNNLLFMTLLILNSSKTIPEQPLILIEKYGLPMVLIVVLFMILVFLGKFFITQFKNKTEIIAKKDKLIEKKSNELVKSKQEAFELNKKLEEFMIYNNHKLSGEELSKNSENTQKVYEIINHIKGKYDFDRLCLFQYHNGGKNINGIDFKKCTVTHEVCDLGIPSLKNLYQNRHISSDYLWSQLIFNKGELYFDDVEHFVSTLKDDDLYKICLLEMDYKSYYSLFIYDYRNKPVGFVVMCSFNEKIILNEEDLIDIKNKMISLGGFIDTNEG